MNSRAYECWQILKMKQKLILLLSIICVLTLVSCQKVVNIDLNTTNPKLSIHGAYVKHLNRLFVQVSKTTSYFQKIDAKNDPTISSGVKIELKNDSGTVLASTEDGSTKKIEYKDYSSYSEAPVSADRRRPAYEVEVDLDKGKIYTLEVTYEGQIYKSSSTLMGNVIVDEATYVEDTFNSETNKKYDVEVKFQDDEEAKYYLIKYVQYDIVKKVEGGQYQNNITIDYNGDTNYFTPDGELVPVNGNNVNSVFLSDFSIRLINELNRKGPQFKTIINAGIFEANLPPTNGHAVAVTKIDEKLYLYLKDLEAIINTSGGPGGGSISAPGNPQKYWKTSDGKSADVLGYFGCVNYTIKEQVVRK